MRSVRDSRHWPHLLQRYAKSPSIALCRVPELELLSGIELRGPVLDHCCGDGYIAAHAFPGRILDAGFDLRAKPLVVAKAAGNFHELHEADASKRLPFEDARFGTIFNNSAIEHIPDLDAVLAEVARVLRPGGNFHFNVLNTRFFEWWPLDARSRSSYREFQPFYHALDENGWRSVLERHGFGDVTFKAYMPRATAEQLAHYDYVYSAFYIRHRPSLAVMSSLVMPAGLLMKWWDQKFGSLVWDAPPGEGAGFLVTATRSGR
jgi:SAM-dependent methyltransferase